MLEAILFIILMGLLGLLVMAMVLAALVLANAIADILDERRK